MGVELGLIRRYGGWRRAEPGLDACGASAFWSGSRLDCRAASGGCGASLRWLTLQKGIPGGRKGPSEWRRGGVLSAVYYIVGRDMLRVSFVMGDATLSGGSSAGCGGNGFALPRGRAQHVPSVPGMTLN